MNKNRESRRQSNPTCVCVCVCAQSVVGRMTWPQSGSTKCIGVAQQPVDALFKSTISRCCTRAHVSPDAPPQALTYYPGPVFSAFLFHLFFKINFIILCFFLSLQLQVEIGISFAAQFIQCQDAIPNLFCCFSVFFFFYSFLIFYGIGSGLEQLAFSQCWTFSVEVGEWQLARACTGFCCLSMSDLCYSLAKLLAFRVKNPVKLAGDQSCSLGQSVLGSAS